jgi:hypothetical protein
MERQTGRSDVSDDLSEEDNCPYWKDRALSSGKGKPVVENSNLGTGGNY